jgi:serpin B
MRYVSLLFSLMAVLAFSGCSDEDPVSSVAAEERHAPAGKLTISATRAGGYPGRHARPTDESPVEPADESPQDDDSVADGEEPHTTQSFTLARSADVERDRATPEPMLLRTQATSINRFAVRLYQQLIEEDQNLFFSPYSVHAALGMALAGARGATEEEMRTALQASLHGDDLHMALNGLDQSLHGHAEEAEGIQLNIVNSIWGQTGWDFRTDYLDLLARSYGAGINLLDFISTPEESRQIINQWVSDQTRERIQNLLPGGSIHADTRLVLTNAVYFLADWLYQFNGNLTTDEPFYRLDGSTVDVPLMQIDMEETFMSSGEVELEYAYDWSVGLKALNLYYQGKRLCMTVLLPDSGTFENYEGSLTMERIDALLTRLSNTSLELVRLPRFRFTSSVPLGGPLQVLGMRAAFDPGRADFSGIDDRRDLFISQVFHKAFVDVDEQGTEAAAATAVVMVLSAVPPPPPQFVADRPFIFLIRDTETGLILFMGRVLDPSVSE